MAKDKKRFKYKKRTAEDYKNREKNAGAGAYDNPFKKKVKIFSPGAGAHRIRILPNTMENAEHYGIDVYIHYGIGDGNRYLCARKMKKEACPVCEELEVANREGDEKYAAEIAPRRRTAVWLIDRDHEDEGPQLWPMPFASVDKEITGLAHDDRSGEVFSPDDPEDGYDVEFTVEGKGKKTNYVKIKLARKSTPLSDDEDQTAEWLEYVTENPLDKMLVWFDYDHIAKVFSGGKSKKQKRDEDEDDEKPRTRSEKRRRDEDDEDEKPRKKRRDEEEDEDEDEEDEPRRAKKRPVDDEDEDLDDEDEDEKPRKKKKRDEEEDEDDEDEKPRKKKRRDEEEDEEEDEDDEDEKPRKKRRDEEEDEEEDEDEDERPKGKGKEKIRKALKRRRDEDEDDE